MGRMTNRDGHYSRAYWPKPSSQRHQQHIYKDLEWLEGFPILPPEDVALPFGYSINPDETEESAIQGPPKDKLLELWEELNTPALSENDIEKFRDEPN